MLPDEVSHEALFINDYTSDLLTIVIPLHNEENNIPKLLKQLKQQDTKAILVLDHCSDCTEEKCQELSCEESKIRIINNSYEHGKKNALRTAIEIVDTPYILCTDADCSIPAKWTHYIGSYLNSKSVKPDLLLMPVGVASAHNNGVAHIRERLFTIDFISLQLSTAGCALSGSPSMANGANILFSRELYLSHDPHSDYISGDDMFLLSEAKKMARPIEYLYSPDVMVSTTMPPSFRAFIRQHSRWLRKGTGYTDTETKKLALSVFISNISWPILFILLPWSPFWQWIPLCLFILKTYYERKLLIKGKALFGISFREYEIIYFALIYPFLMAIIAIVSIFRSKRQW